MRLIIVLLISVLFIRCQSVDRSVGFNEVKKKYARLSAAMLSGDSTALTGYTEVMQQLHYLHKQTFSGDAVFLSTDAERMQALEAGMKDKPDSEAYHFFKSVLRLKHDYPALVRGEYQLVDTSNPHILAYTSAADGRELLTILNMNEDNRAFKGTYDFVNMPLLACNYPEGPLPVLTTSLLLRPFEGRVYVVK